MPLNPNHPSIHPITATSDGFVPEIKAFTDIVIQEAKLSLG